MTSDSIHKYDSQYCSWQTVLWTNPRITRNDAFSSNFSLVKERGAVRNVKKNNFQECKTSVDERLIFLSDNLDDDQDPEIFEKSKGIVNKFISCAKLTSIPLISVDDAGYIVFEWRNYNHYDVFVILFKTTDSISYVAVKQKKIVLKGSGLVSEVAKIVQKSKDE